MLQYIQEELDQNFDELVDTEEPDIFEAISQTTSKNKPKLTKNMKGKRPVKSRKISKKSQTKTKLSPRKLKASKSGKRREDSSEKLSSFESVRKYLLGYALTKKVKCENCLSIMKSSCETKDTFINAKDYGFPDGIQYLCYPTDFFSRIFEKQYNVFETIFKENAHILKLKSTILTKCIAETNKFFPEWFNENDPCAQHKKDILDYLLKCLIKRNAQWIVSDTKKSQKYLSRMRHLKE